MPRRILILDDEPTLRRTLRFLVERTYSADVTEASTNEEALQVMSSIDIDLIITDLVHPGGDGIELLRSLKEDPKLCHIPVIVQSANSFRLELDAWRSGARAVLDKPYTLAVLLGAIDRQLNTRSDPDVALIEFGSETPTLDYKATLPLDSKTERARLAKDVISMANTGGGTIVVGVKEAARGDFRNTGVSELELQALETTRLNQALRAYLDPPVAVTTRRISYRGKAFAIIQVPSAAPDIVMAACQHSEAGLYTGRIYGRTSAAESAALERSSEIRALVQRMAKLLTSRIEGLDRPGPQSSDSP